MVKKLYVFKDTINKDKVAFAFYDNKWREDSITLTKKERERIKKKPLRTKFQHKVYVLNGFQDLRG